MVKYRVFLNDSLIADRVVPADRFVSRLRGLMFRRSLPEGEGLWLRPANGIHTHWMHFAIDALFLDGGHTVVYIARSVPPWRIVPPVGGTKSVLELSAGAGKEVKAGDRLVFETIPEG